jgi:hypothetical protein
MIAVAARSATGRQEEPPSKATGFDPAKEDHSPQTLPDVVDHYSRVRKLRLSDAQKRDLVEYLETL